MKIGITSDLHGNIEAWQTIINGIFKDVDQVLLAGDTYGAGLVDPFTPWYQPQKLKKQIAHSPLPLLCIRGNCDANIPYPETETGEIFNRKFYMCHGHHCLDESTRVSLAQRNQAFYFIFGHTHEWHLSKKNGIIMLNPGSPTIPDKNKNLTVALMDDQEISILDINSRKSLASLANK